VRGWKDSGGLDAFGRAKVRVKELLASYTKPELDSAKVADLHAFVLDLAKKAGMDSLPAHELSPTVV
jgi:trimethylamine:corrinoid methyltransferase-like protein